MKTMMPKKYVLLGVLLAAFAHAAWAEKTDKEKPINIESDSISMDDIKKVQIFTGNVVFTQGTMQMRTEKLVVTQDADGFQKGIATGGPGGLARFKQKRDDSNDYMEGEGERVEHDARTEKTEFFGKAWVRNGQDEVKGVYISYDALTEKYLVTNGNQSKSATGNKEARVRAIIQPKSKSAPEEKPESAQSQRPSVQLKPSSNTSAP